LRRGAVSFYFEWIVAGAYRKLWLQPQCLGTLAILTVVTQC
jgi:hypothetical protein